MRLGLECPQKGMPLLMVPQGAMEVKSSEMIEGASTARHSAPPWSSCKHRQLVIVCTSKGRWVLAGRSKMFCDLTDWFTQSARDDNHIHPLDSKQG
jgi:hypothetical protein